MRDIVLSAGDAITAKLVEQAGFDGIWVSGFEASARLGLADNGSITMTEMLNIAKPIVRAVKIPVYVDVDTGYGNFKRTVREFENIGVAGISVEDNLPEKQNSLWGGKCALMTPNEFADKINVPHKLKIIARTEALIRGYSMVDAEMRLKQYHLSGADILLPHTRSRKFIMQPFKSKAPFAIVPTKFPECSNKQLFDKGYSMVIWANQTERVKIRATREMLTRFKVEDNMDLIENELSATLEDMRGLCPLS